MPAPLQLPDGLTQRPLTTADTVGVVEVIAAQELADVGEVVVEEAEIGMPVPQGSPGDRLLESLGHHVRWTSWVLELPEGTAIPDRPLPDGYAVRAAHDAEHEACWTVQEDAFLVWSGRERDTFEEWRASTGLRPGYQPWHLRVVTDPTGEVVAMALIQTNGECCFIARLATRAGAEHGSPRAELSTDSRTGALGLYEKVGMRTTSVWVNRAIAVGAR